MSATQYSTDDLLLKRKSLRRELSKETHLQPIRIAVLGGTTTNELVDFMEILLLSAGFRPEFYQSEYNKYYEDAVFEPQKLVSFRPDIVYVCTSCLNLNTFPSVTTAESDFEALVGAELARFRSIWRSLGDSVGCQIIQNNFEFPPADVLGNLDAVSLGGRHHFISSLNLSFAKESRDNRKLLIHDMNGLSARLGLDNWFDWNRWYSYKIATTPDANHAIARSVTALIGSVYGKSRKCLVLDLDNTLWGGVIGDDGPDKIQIGRETAVAEAYTAFQEYCLALRDRGVLLAVCSKNDDKIARQGFQHPDSVLKLEHFSAFRANWEPKHENIRAIASELNLGVDSFVFVDDNPAEREIVAAQVPGVAVPNVGSDVAQFARILQEHRYFEPIALSQEDLQRAEQYAANAKREEQQARFANYGEYLDSLNMEAEIETFRPVYFERIAQLTNKTNQFNLTTRRCTLSEIESIANDPNHIAIYGRLTDTFGDNGLISVVIGRKEGLVLHLDLWLMSCRVLKRDMELAMLDAVAQRARAAGINELRGYYLRTAKNGMVSDHYEKLGFTCQSRTEDDSRSVWTLDISGGYEPKNRHIKLKELVHG